MNDKQRRHAERMNGKHYSVIPPDYRPSLEELLKVMRELPSSTLARLVAEVQKEGEAK